MSWKGVYPDNDCLPSVPGNSPPVVAWFLLNYITSMEFSIDELTEQVGHTARDFANQAIRPHLMQWDEKQEFPRELFREMGRLGMMGVVVPESYGGSGLSYTEYVTIIVEIAKVCGGIGLSLAAHNSLCTGHILAFGSEEQKKKYLPNLATGQTLGAWGLTEAGTG